MIRRLTYIQLELVLSIEDLILNIEQSSCIHVWLDYVSLPYKWCSIFLMLCNHYVTYLAQACVSCFTLHQKFWVVQAKTTQLCFFLSILEDFTSPTSYLGFSFADLKKDGSWLVEVRCFNVFFFCVYASKLATCLFTGQIDQLQARCFLPV